MHGRARMPSNGRNTAVAGRTDIQDQTLPALMPEIKSSSLSRRSSESTVMHTAPSSQYPS